MIPARVDMGPSAVRYAGLQHALERLGIGAVDHGNIPVRVPESASPEEANAKYLPIIAETCSRLADVVAGVLATGGFPLVLGGDHSIAPERIVFVGLRDVDDGEKRAIRDLGVRAFTMSDIDRVGMARVIEEALAITVDGPASLHVSFDMDGIDPTEAPGVGTPVRGGISYREAHFLMEAVAASDALGSLEITEINPILDRENQTAILAVELILSALGKTTL